MTFIEKTEEAMNLMRLVQHRLADLADDHARFGRVLLAETLRECAADLDRACALAHDAVGQEICDRAEAVERVANLLFMALLAGSTEEVEQ